MAKLKYKPGMLLQHKKTGYIIEITNRSKYHIQFKIVKGTLPIYKNYQYRPIIVVDLRTNDTVYYEYEYAISTIASNFKELGKGAKVLYG